MTKDLTRTNGEMVQAAVDRLWASVGELGQWAWNHPDEMLVGAVPYAAVVAATARHPLSPIEKFIVVEAAYYLGVLALREYRRWKSQPAGGPLPGPRLRKVS
jgi:hypothetical protein